MKTNLPIVVARTFSISSEALWKLISHPGNLNDCHPFCKSNEVIEWNEDVHVDRLVYLNGRTYIRQFLTWDEGEGYTLRIGEENGLQSFVQWKIDAVSENKSRLTITVHPYLLADIQRLFPSCRINSGLNQECADIFDLLSLDSSTSLEQENPFQGTNLVAIRGFVT